MIADPGTINQLVIISISIAIVNLTTVHWVWSKRIKRLRSLIELAKKMDGYYSITVVKLGVYCGLCLLMAVGFFLTDSVVFTAVFILLVVAEVLQWPSPGTFSRDLQIRGNEKDMIMQGKDLIERRKPAHGKNGR